MEPLSLPDPDVQLLSFCQQPNCGQPMGQLRVYTANDPKKIAFKGALVQTCQACYWTRFHTPPYFFPDAEALVQRILARKAGLPAPNATILRPALRPDPAPASSLDDGRVLCGNPSCVTKKGQRTVGSRACVEHKCRKCCIDGYRSARDRNAMREACKVHGQDPVHGLSGHAQPRSHNPLPPPIPAQPNSVSAPAQLNPLAPSFPDDTWHGLQRLPDDAVPAHRPLSHLDELEAAQQLPWQLDPSLLAAAPVPGPSRVRGQGAEDLHQESGRRRQPLAMPLPPAWRLKHSEVQTKKEETETLKKRQQEILERKKRTCDLVVWHSNGQEPIELAWHVDTYPDLQIKSVLPLVHGYKLTDSSLLDWYQGKWKVITIATVISVERGQRVLLRLRPNLNECLVDCPGLLEELEKQPKKSSGLKRNAEVIVSPIKKAARAQTSVSVPRRSPPIDDDTFISDSLNSQPSIPQSHPEDVRVSVSHSRRNAVQPLRLQTAASASDMSCSSQPTPPNAVQPIPIPTAASVSDMSHSSQPPPVRKQWPDDFFVSEINDGFERMREMMRTNPKMTRKKAFPECFGVPYVKSTVQKYSFIWDAEVNRKRRDYYISLRLEEDGKWKNFMKACKEDMGVPEPVSETELIDTQSPPESQSATVLRGSTANSREAVETGRIDPHWWGELQQYGPVSNDKLDDAENFDLSFELENDPEADSDGRQQCEFCDEYLPDGFDPSTHLIQMRDKLEGLTWPDPTIDNPRHRTARTFVVYQTYCERLHFECYDIPKAQAAGWPEDPGFAHLYDRILRLRGPLLLALENIKQWYEVEQIRRATAASREQGADTPTEEPGPVDEPDNKACSSEYFFKASLKRYENVGSSVEGIGSQYQAFTGQSAGYYGDEGYAILTLAVMYMFPDKSLELKPFHPLSWRTLIRDVLVPEAAVFLIQQDLRLARRDAIETLRESSRYGTLMHGDADSENVRRVLSTTRAQVAKAESQYRLYQEAESSLSFEDWVKEEKAKAQLRRVKEEVREEKIDLSRDVIYISD